MFGFESMQIPLMFYIFVCRKYV